MKQKLEPRESGGVLRTLRLRSPIYSTPLLADLDGDGLPELFAGGESVWGWRVDGRGDRAPGLLPGWPRAGSGPFASSPQAGDIDGDGRLEIVAGSDDDRLYAWRLDGSAVPGFPVQTGGDVYSTPALLDLDGDGRLEIVFGSDDGFVHAVDGRGRGCPGWPVRTGGFVSASPAAADLDGDGRPEIVIGSWDRKLYVLSASGGIWSSANGHPGWPARVGHIVWSSALLEDLDGDGRVEIAVAADLLHVFDIDGRPKPGWPRWIGGFTPSSPAAARLDRGGAKSIVIGGDGLRAFDAAGRPRGGFPYDTKGHVWSRPCACDLDGDGIDEIYAGSWDGGLHGVGAGGERIAGFPVPTEGRVFGGPASGRYGGGALLAFGSTDGTVRILGLGREPIVPAAREPSARRADEEDSPETSRPSLPPPWWVSWRIDPGPPLANRPSAITLERLRPSSVRAAFLVYRWRGEEEHPSPFVPSAGRLTALLQPLPAGTEVAWHLLLEGWDGETLRVPRDTDEILRVRGSAWRKAKRLAKS